MAWVFVLLLLLHSVSFANIQKTINKREISYIDSLLYNGNLAQINNFFDSKNTDLQKLSLSESKLDEYSKIRNQYISIERFVTKLDSIDELTLNCLINQYNSFEHWFIKSKAGKKSFEVYQKYKTLCEKGDKVNGLKFYRIAYFFKLKFIHENIDIARNKVRIAYQFYNNNYFDKAKANINILFDINKNIKLPSSVIDSIKTLDLKIINAEKRIEHYHKLWKEEKNVKNYLNVSIGYNLIRQNEVNNTLLEFNQRSNNTIEWVEMKYVPSKFVSNYSASIDYRVFKSIFFGLHINYSVFTYSAKNTLDLLFYNFDINNYSSHIFLKCQTRDNIGLRPFYTFGVGYLISYRKQSEGIILKFTDDIETPPTTNYYDVPAKTYKYSQIVYEVGFDYLHTHQIKILLGTKLSLYQNINFNSLINQFNLALGAYISYWF